MNTSKKERSRSRSRENNNRFSKSAKIKTLKSPLMTISSSDSKVKSNKSSNSNSIGFQLKEDEKEITINYEKIATFEDFSQKLDKIKLPCTLKNLDILDIDKIDITKEIKFPKLKFESMPEENIIFLNNDSARKKFIMNLIKELCFHQHYLKELKTKLYLKKYIII